MGRSRSRSRDRGGYGESEYRSKPSRQKSRDKSRSRSRESYDRKSSKSYDYEETKEERRARRARERAEKRRDEEDEGRRSRGAYDHQTSSAVPAGYGAAPYPESPEDTRAAYGGGEYHQTPYPADSYAASQYTSTNYPQGATHTDYSTTDYSQGQQAYTQPYGTPQHEGSTYYPPPAPAAPYGDTTYSPAPTGQYGDHSYSAAPQAPYPTTQYPTETQPQSGYYGASPPPVAPYPHEGNQYQQVPQQGYGQPQTGYGDSNVPGAGYIHPPEPSSYGNSTPRNPSYSNYNPRAEPSGPPPEAEADFVIPQHVLQGGGDATAEEWQPTAAPEAEKVSAFKSFRRAFHDVTRGITNSGGIKAHHGVHEGGVCRDPNHFQSDNRFGSFGANYSGNKIKWFVDGKDYCWAVAAAIANARESIWILDWWLSPELHLRRPAAKYPDYRLDRMLRAAAERGVKVNIIVYKEVTQALTLSSAHTKHYLEGLHPNIGVFRHPDHTPDGKVVLSKLLSGDLLSTLSGFTNTDQLVLYWAHHEKLLLVDGLRRGEGVAFMGGLDLCWGRWDLAHHPLSDVHPANVKDTLFLGQDYNNARVMDFHTVDQWTQNKLQRTQSGRMGWSDVSLCFSGPTIDDLKQHFAERWNFLYQGKYAHKTSRYTPIEFERFSGHSTQIGSAASRFKSDMKGLLGSGSGPGSGGKSRRQKDRGDQGYDDPMAFGDDSEEEAPSKKRSLIEATRKLHIGPGGGGGGGGGGSNITDRLQNALNPRHGTECQIIRSISPWSHGQKTEHSIQNAYIQIITSARHFIYIENQFFITTSASDDKWPVKNRIGEAIVNRIIRAHQQKEKFRIIVIMPAVPAFAGPLRDEASLGTRAIMEFQYDSISRGGKGHSIYEKLNEAGVNPLDYIRFYNLRNYDRLNISRELENAEAQTKLEYEVAQQALNDRIGGDWQTAQTQGGELDAWGRTQNIGSGVWDSVAQCAMLGGGDVRDAPWTGDPDKEIDAFVSEELYVHSKVLIADDRIVICGSANLNDRSQLGDHDSEIAIVVEDHTPLNSLMNGQSYVASSFAATLRRHLFRKHLGLIPAQPADYQDANSLPVPEPNLYDFDSAEDKLVMDPLSDSFWAHWNQVAKTNTDAFATIFHPVPYDGVRNWDEYKEYFSKYFDPSGTPENPIPPKYKWGHVVKENFPPGAEGARAVKEILAKVRGGLVEMPLKFLQDIDLAVEAASFNAMTETLYV